MKTVSATAFKNSNTSTELYSNFIQKCMNGEFCESPNQRLMTVCVFACVFSGIACYEHLEAFYKKLISSKLELAEINEHIIVELMYTKAGHPANIIIIDRDGGEQFKSLTSRSLDSQTIAALIGYLEAIRKKNLPKISFEALIKKIYSTIHDNKPSKRDLFNFPGQLFLASQYLFSTNTPEFLFQVATGKTFSGSSELDSAYYHPKDYLISPSSTDKDQTNRKSLFCKSDFEKLLLRTSGSCTKKEDYDFIEKILNICERENTHKQRKKTIVQFEKQMTLFTGSVPAFILLNWIYDGLHEYSTAGSFRWGEGKMTPFKYLKVVYKDWLHEFKAYDITELNEVEMENIYHELLYKIRLEQKTVDTILPVLFKYIAQKYPDSISSPEFILEEDGINFVRTRLISEEMFTQLLFEINTLYAGRDKHFRRSVEVLLTLLFRLGLRPKEAFNLQLKNLSFNCVCEIEIHRTNKSGKTASSDRRITVSDFLTKAELEKLKRVYNTRLFSSNNGKNGLLFSQMLDVNVKFDEKLINKSVIKILSEIAGYRIVLYQFRHTFISNLFLVCFANEKTTRHLTAYTEEQIERIRANFSANPHTVLDQVSSIVGHLSPSTTLTSYAHRVYFSLINYLESGIENISLKALSKLTSIPLKELRIVTDEPEVSINKSNIKLTEYLRQHLAKLASIKKVPLCAVPEQRIHNQQIWRKNALDLHSTIQISTQLEKGNRSEEVAAYLDIDIEVCKRVRIAIDDLLPCKPQFESITTEKEELKKNEPERQSLGVPKISSTKVFDAASKALAILKWNESAEKKKQICNYFIRSSAYHSYVKFSDLDFLISTVLALKDIFPIERWQIRYEKLVYQNINVKIIEYSKQIPSLKFTELDSYVKDKSKFPDGRFYLHYTDQDEDSKLKIHPTYSKYSDNLPKVAFFWAEVFRMATQNTEAGLEGERKVHNINDAFNHKKGIDQFSFDF